MASIKQMEAQPQKSKTTLYIESVGLLAGVILGAGIFALPYSMARAGVFWGLIHFAIAVILMMFLQILYGEIAYVTKGRHRFTGYVLMYLGKRANRLAFVTILLGYYGSLLAYGLLGGIFLNNILNGTFGILNVFWLSIIFFTSAGAFSLLRFDKIGLINFYLTIPLLLFILYLIGTSWSFIDFNNFNFDFSFNPSWFLPYGVWIFALGGFATIPEARDLMQKASLRSFKNIILISVSLASIFSLIFSLGVLGITGESTSKDALTGLKIFLGQKGIIVGSIIGFLAVFTSFLAMAIDLKNIFRVDYKINFLPAWTFAVLPPLLLFLIGARELITILSLVGAVLLGIIGIFILKMSNKIKSDGATASHTGKIFKWIVGVAILLGSIYEIWNILA